MSDPAIEAAQRALNAYAVSATCLNSAVAAAREALKPIRKLHSKADMPWGAPYCLHCKAIWPCATARLVYSTEETAK